MSWLHRDRFTDENAFMAKYGDLTAASQELRDAFTALLRPHILRRTKDDVMKTLPARHEVLVPVPLAPPQVGGLYQNR